MNLALLYQSVSSHIKYIRNGSTLVHTDIFCASKLRMKSLYRKIHPGNKKHDFKRRLECLKSLQDIGYQTGTGVMIGLPFQTMDDLASRSAFHERVQY